MRFKSIGRRWITYGVAAGSVILIAVLLGTIYLTRLSWEWETFLGGVLFAAVVSLASRTSRAEWRMARRSGQVGQLRDKLAGETTLRRQAETGHETSRAELRFITEAMPAMMFYIDTEQILRRRNRGFSEWLGQSGRMMEGTHLRDVLGAPVYKEMQRHLERALGGADVRFEHTSTASPGQVYRFLVTLVPYLGPGAKVLGVYGFLVDATERRHLQARPGEALAGTAQEGSASGPREEKDLYLDSINEELVGWEDVADNLFKALEQDKFILFAQTIVPLAGTGNNCHEILIRLREEEENLMPPGAFIPLAEKYNMMPAIDRWVVQHLLAWVRARRTAKPGWKPTMYGINLSAASFSEPEFARFVQKELETGVVPPATLCFELDEADAIEHREHAARLGKELRTAGCHVALGGFGNHEASFDMLKYVNADFVKINRGISLDILRNPVALAKVKAIARVCQTVQVKTIAEFVESNEMTQKLRALGIDYAQGFAVARPAPLDEIP